MLKLKTKISSIFFSDAFFLGTLSVFIFINWFLMIESDILACNDYYPYYLAQEKLFSGTLNLEYIPPLFPLLLGLFGRLVKLFGGSFDHFILGGQIISLLAAFGVLYFTHKLLKKWAAPTTHEGPGKHVSDHVDPNVCKLSRNISKKHTPGFAILGTIFLSISPFFLKLLSTAQTDMLYLFFVAALFYFLAAARDDAENKQKFCGGAGGSFSKAPPARRRQEKKIIPAAGFTLAALLTRFEGVLLIGSALVNYFDLKKKTWKYLLLSAIPAGIVLYFLFDRFAHRLIDKIELIVSKGYYFYYFTHPGELAHLLYGNLLYFVPNRFPGTVKWFLFFILLGLFFFGCYRFYKTKRQWFFSITFYMFIFILAKGYTQSLNPEMEFRRWLSIIWIFFIIALCGLNFLWQKIRVVKKINIPVKLALVLFFALVVMFRPVIRGTPLLLALFLLPLLLYGVKRIIAGPGKLKFAGWFLILTFFFSQVYFDGLKRTFRYLNKDSNAGSYMAANWVNSRPKKTKILVYAYRHMFRYYVEKEKMRGSIVFKDKEIYADPEKLTTEFMKKLKKRKIKYIVFDGYRSPMYKAGNAVKDLLYRERDRGVYFKVKKHLFYKGKYVASVLTPNY
ncbi:MAG: hypothetical protein KAW12_10985 [Candidatus Aminicenantes bacterium]|nr:hypothetical protein [Candidatus Aminicenantes bacterium]